MSIGGLLGSIAAAFLTQNYEPRYCFMFSSTMGLVIAFFASRLNVALEMEGRSQDYGNHSLWEDIKRNLRDIKEAFKIR